MPRQLEVKGVGIAYGSLEVVRHLEFTLDRGAIGCLLGPSGCGKTTLLRAVAGFEPLTAGEIHLHGRVVSAPGRTVAPEQRRVGMVFQDFALFPHLTVEQNLAFGLRGAASRERRQRIDELLRLVDLEPARRLYPHELSGGMQQRIALARAMAPRPDILLMDEPFSAIDTTLREQIAREVRDLLRRDGTTALLVTHDQLEAFAVADRIGVLGNGRLHQWDTGFALYHAPADRFVADFIGQCSMLPGRVVDERGIEIELGRVSGRGPHGIAAGRQVEVLLRPDDVVLDDASPARAVVAARTFRGADYRYDLRLPSGRHLLCSVQSHHDHAPGETVGIRLDTQHLVAFPAEPGQGGDEPSVVS